ncbi:MAG TPA: dienelactone hydrolase family protein [Candidatus Binataceae bacterium]|nr:dienelactone hydrolase family protein [Candidatus Binataceae bacterium]
MDIVKQDVTVQTGNEKMPAFVARPASGGPYPGLVVVMEAFGLNSNIKALSERFAAEGFVVIAPNLYFRQPNNVVGYDNLPGALKLMQSLTDDQVVADMSAAINQLKTIKEVKPKFGTTGFCMGGRVAFLTAVRNGDVHATAPFYGGGMTRAGQPGGKAPTDDAANLKGPVLAFFGGKDAFIPMTEVDKFRDALNKAGKPAEVVLYADADHGFMCDDRPSYHPGHAAEAFPKTVAFFKQNLN